MNPVLRSGREAGDISRALRISLAVSPFVASSIMAILVARPNGANTRFSRPGAKAYRHKKKKMGEKVSSSQGLSQYVKVGSFSKYLTVARGHKT